MAPGDTLDWFELTDALLHALDNAEIGVAVTVNFGSGPRPLHYNAAAATILGADAAELARREPTSFLTPEELPRFLPLADEGMSGPRETWVITGDGRRLPIELGLARATYRGIPAVITFFQNISARIETQEALRTSEARFRQLAEASPDSITVLSGDRFLYANPAAVRMSGFENVADLLAMPVGATIPEDEARTMRERLARVRQGERLAPIEYHSQREDGSVLTLEVSSILTEFEGQPAVLAYSRDVSQRNRLQAELIQSERMAAVGTLAAGVAHEINNPLTYVMLRLQGLRRSLAALLPDPETRRAFDRQLDDVVEGSQRVADIVRNLLSFARNDDDHEDAATEVEQAIDSAAKLAATALRDRVRLERDYGGVGAVRGGQSRVGQVFLNLLINAAQAFPEDAPERNIIRVRTRKVGDEVVIEVADNGPGIQRAHRQRVFEPFFTTKGDCGGTGLGLAITRSVVDTLGGRIEIADGIDGGASFVVTLAAATPDRAIVAPAPVGVQRGPARILIIDDEQLICTALAAVLGDDHRVTAETDSRRALERLRHDPPYDVVFCDLSMPALTGPDLYDCICQEQAAYASRFVFITGGATSERASSFLEGTEAPVIHKPFTTAAIAQAVERLMAPAAERR